MEPNPSIGIVGLPWYEADSYQAVMALMHDRNTLFRTHAEWLGAAKRTEDVYRKKVAAVVRVVLDEVQFPAWCATNRPGLHVDGKVRADYAAFVAAQQHRAGEEGARRH